MPLDPQVASLIERMTLAGGTPVDRVTPVVAGRVLGLARSRRGCQGGRSGRAPVRQQICESKATTRRETGLTRPSSAATGVVGRLRTLRSATSRTGASPTQRVAVIVAMSHQKAPEHKFPVPLDDAFATTGWVLENAASLGIDPSRVGVGGEIAGANLATAVCLRSTDDGLQVPAFQVHVYPPTDHGESRDYPSQRENAEGYLLSSDTMRWFWQQYLSTPEEGQHPYVSTVRA